METKYDRKETETTKLIDLIKVRGLPDSEDCKKKFLKQLQELKDARQGIKNVKGKKQFRKSLI